MQNYNLSSKVVRRMHTLDSLNKMIKNPPKGVSITKFANDIVSVSMPVPAELKSSEAETAVQIVDITNKLLLGSRLYGKGNKTLQCMMFRYNDCILKGFKQETQQMLPSGIMANIKTVADIENLNLSIL